MSVESTLDALAATDASDGWSRALHAGAEVADRWTIVRFIAAGGMGEVYEAHDRLLDSRVALKILRIGQTNAHERFVREVQLARKVSHPNVCRLHDAGTHAGLSFLTMELLDGEALSDRIKRGPMTVAEARPILADLAAALDAAHAAGVIHRDFKPHNVMLVKRGDGVRAVVTDFGIARPVDDTRAVALTSADEIIGTPAYMAPEQVSGKPVTAATDVYSFGVVAYQMVTGSLPFLGQNAREVATARLTEAPRPPRELVNDLDRRWDAAILAALSMDPAARPASAGGVLAMADATRAPRPARTARVAVLIAIVVALAVAAIVWIATRSSAPARVVAAADAAVDASSYSEEMNAHYIRGRDAFDAKRYDEAIASFLEIDEEMRHPAIVFNLAQAYRIKGDAHQAAYHYRRVLAVAQGPQYANLRKGAEDALREVEAAIAADGGVSP